MLARSPVTTFPCRFGRYELLQRLGTGGMAEVFKARRRGAEGFEKIVVIKRLLPSLGGDEEMVRMLIDEARLTALVQHPSIVQVTDLEETESGEHYIVMEHVDGTDLRKLLGTAASCGVRIPPWLSVHVIARILDGIAYAHDLLDEAGRRRNVVHRDIAPDNVFISKLGEIKLGDFGVAQDDTRVFQPFSDRLRGKFSYMAPEVFLGRPADHRSDVFAAGVVLWECLAQRPLFRAQTSVETMKLVCSAPRRPPSAHADDVPAHLDDCVLAAISPDPKERPGSARELMSRLVAILAGLRRDAGPLAVRGFLEGFRREPPSVEERSRPSEGRHGEGRARSSEIIIDEASIIDELIARVEGLGTTSSPELAEEVTAEVEPWSDAKRRAVEAGAETAYEIINPPREGPTKDLLRQVVHVRRGPREDDAEGAPVPRASAARIPIPGAPASVETADILAHRRSPERLRKKLSSSAEVWTRYEGPWPFWIRASGHADLGPAGLSDILDILWSCSEDPVRRGIELSADGARWVPYERARDLFGLDLLGPSGDLAHSPSALEAGTMAELCGLVAKRKTTGRLRVWHGRRARAERAEADECRRATEIHVVRGEPTYVATNDPRLELVEQLKTEGGLRGDTIEAALHEALEDDRPLEDVLRARFGIQLEASWPRLMASRLRPVFALDLVSWVVAHDRPVQRLPFAGSLLALVPRDRVG